MVTPNPAERRARGWAIAGGAVLLAGVIAIIIAAVLNQPGARPEASESPQLSTSPTSPSAEPGGDDLVDAGAVQNGWRGEPVTTDPEVYVAAALEAAATFDTTKASREDWLEYLDSWFTPDTRYTSTEDQQTELEAARLKLRQGVVLPEREWDSLAAEDGRVAATAGDVLTAPVTDDASGDMVIGTADVVLEFTRSDGSGVESSYDESVRVSVQVLCGPGSVPAPDSAQQAGDCK